MTRPQSKENQTKRDIQWGVFTVRTNSLKDNPNIKPLLTDQNNLGEN